MFFDALYYKVICVGSTSKDVFFPTDEGIIIETPEDILSKEKIAFELGGKIRIKNRFEAVGGVAANVSHGLTRLGYHVGCYSKIGKDETGDWILEEFRREAVSTDLLFVDKTVATDLSFIVVMTQNGERTIFHNRDANEKLEIEKKKFKNTEWIFVSALNGEWEKNLDTLLEIKKEENLSFALNPGQHNIKNNVSAVLKAVAVADVLLLNKDEAIELVMQIKKDLPREKLDDEMFLLQTLHSFGAKIIGMTDGKRGAWSFDGTAFWFCPIVTQSSVVDSTGCGDAFSSGFFGAILGGLSLDTALSYGIVNSGSVIGEYGAIDGLLHRQIMEQYTKSVHPERLN